MNRRYFLKTGSAIGATSLLQYQGVYSFPDDDIRAAFPRMRQETYLNAAGLMPLGTFSEEGLQRFQDFQRLGAAEERGAHAGRMQSEIRGLFASLVGAEETEIGFVHCTKAGEQIALDGLGELRRGHNIVTNDLHFSGSLHNLIGLRNAGVDVRIVRARDWSISVDEMRASMDDNTALVCVSLVSNINGHVEDIRALSEFAHERGALVYADIIQAAGIVPVDVHAMGIDIAACSCYKWLYGVHGTGFLFVNQKLQGTRLADRLFPGHVRHNYEPWIIRADADLGDYGYEAPVDARRYEPGHVSYLGYAAAYEGLKFLADFGVEEALQHSVALNKRLLAQLDPGRYTCITPDVGCVPLVTLRMTDGDATRSALQQRLQDAKVIVSLSGDRIRVSPAVYNNESDVDRLIEVLNG
jgi:selenocysteine lyase/cysteine desulfurase